MTALSLANASYHTQSHYDKETVRTARAARHTPPESATLDTSLFATLAVRDVSVAMNGILADVFALYLKTKNFHWHVRGSNIYQDHVTLNEQAHRLHAMTDAVAEHVRKLGGTMKCSLGHLVRTQRIPDNDADYVTPSDMQAELCEDNKTVIARMREVQVVCQERNDIATTNMIEAWIDETGSRIQLLSESGRAGSLH